MSRSSRVDVDIRPYSDGDFPLLKRLLGDPSMMLHLGGPESLDVLRERHEHYLAYDGSTEGQYTIVVGTGRVAAGWVGYWESEWQGDGVWECGWHVLPEFQGHGIASAGATLMLVQARTRGMHRFVHAFPSVDNAASNAVCSALGFELLGEVDLEYPKGSMMRCNDWRMDLSAGRSGQQAHRAAGASARPRLIRKTLRCTAPGGFVEGKGYYVGTLDPSGRRVRWGGLFMRGNGSWTIDESGLSFLRRLTRNPIRIPRASIRAVGLSESSWWAGRWLLGNRVVEVAWTCDDGSTVVSGFLFSGRPEVNAEIAELLSPGQVES